MDDSGLDAARPRRRNWWDLDQDPEQQPDYPPIGLEGFRPNPPRTIGFNVQAPQPEPSEEFARSWTRAAEATSDAPQLQLRPYDPFERQFEQPDNERPPWGVRNRSLAPWLSIASAEGAEPRSSDPPSQPFARPPVVAASVGNLMRKAIADAALLAAEAGPIVAHAGREIASGVESAMQEVGQRGAEIAALLNPMHAPRLLTPPADWGARRTELGNNLHFLERRDGTSSFRKSDGGFLGTGVGESIETLPVDVRVVVRPDGTREHAVDWDALQARIGYDKTLEAMQKIPPGMGGPNKEPDDSKPPNGKPSIPIPPPDYLSRRLLGRYPDLIRRDSDQWSADGIDLTEAELEHEKGCGHLQKERGQPPPLSRYEGADARETPFGKVPPDIGEPAAKARSMNESHNKGVLGEKEMAIRLRNANTSHRVVYYGNPPGLNGPDGIATSERFGGVMTLESKYSSDPRSITPREVSLEPVHPSKILERLRIANESGRVSDAEVDRAVGQLADGNYSHCIGGTGEAHNGYFLVFRDNRPVYVKRYKP